LKKKARHTLYDQSSVFGLEEKRRRKKTSQIGCIGTTTKKMKEKREPFYSGTHTNREKKESET